MGGDGVDDQLLGLDRAAAKVEMPGHDLARAAVDDGHQVRPAVLGDPDAGHVHLPQLAGALDPENAGPLAALERTATLDQPMLAHHPQDALAVHRHAQLAAHERADHPVAIGLIRLRRGDR